MQDLIGNQEQRTLLFFKISVMAIFFTAVIIGVKQRESNSHYTMHKVLSKQADPSLSGSRKVQSTPFLLRLVVGEERDAGMGGTRNIVRGSQIPKERKRKD